VPTIPTNLQRVDYGSDDGSIWTGQHTQVINEASATRILTLREAGSTCCFDLAAGVVYTLPAPQPGMQFEFFSTVTITSNSAKIITNAATVFLLGEVFTYTTATASGAGFAFNGSTHVACTMNGTTTGGIIGTWIKVKALSATQWLINGNIVGSGTIATPAATS
jgi:hypothetical protein